jgi:hypothetical protein
MRRTCDNAAIGAASVAAINAFAQEMAPMCRMIGSPRPASAVSGQERMKRHWPPVG